MLSPITPWTAIGPDHYLRATQEGMNTGLSIAAMRQRAKETEAQRALQQSELNQRQQFAGWELGQRQQQAAEAMRARERATQATLALRREYEMGRLEAAKRAEEDRAWKAKQPSIHPAGGGLYSIDPVTGKVTSLVEPTDKAFAPSHLGQMLKERQAALDAGDTETAKQYDDYLNHLNRNTADNPVQTYLKKQTIAAQQRLARAQASGEDPASIKAAQAELKVLQDQMKAFTPGGTPAPGGEEPTGEEDDELAPEAPPTASKSTGPGFLQRAFGNLPSEVPSGLGAVTFGAGRPSTSTPAPAAPPRTAFPGLPQPSPATTTPTNSIRVGRFLVTPVQ